MSLYIVLMTDKSACWRLKKRKKEKREMKKRRCVTRNLTLLHSLQGGGECSGSNTPQKDNATQTHTIPSLCFIIYSFPKWNLQLHATAVTALFMCVRVLRTCYGISEPWPSLWGVCWTLQRKRKMTRSSTPGEISCHSSRPSGSAASCLLLHWCVVLRGFGLWLHRNRSTSCDG